MAITKPLTVDDGQIARLQPGDGLQIARLNLGPLGPAIPLVLNTITITKSWHQVFIASGTTAQRSVRTILGGLEGDILILQKSLLSDALIIDDNAGNIRSAGNFTLNVPEDKITLLCTGLEWHELTRSNN